MWTVVTAAAIGRSCSAGNKADIESGAVVVVGEYSIIELCICVAIDYKPYKSLLLLLIIRTKTIGRGQFPLRGVGLAVKKR